MSLKIGIDTQALKEISKMIDKFAKDFNKSPKIERNVKMNFLEAVQALNDGLCEEIKRPKWVTGFKFKDNKLMRRDAIFYPCKRDLLADDWELVKPIKQYEDEEVIVYLTRGSNENFYTETPIDSTSIKLTGVRRVEVKPKVKRHERCVNVDRIVMKSGLQRIIAPNTKVFVEWYEDVD